MIPLNEKKNKLARLSASVAIDQLTAAPFAFSVFLTFRGWYDGKSVEQIRDKFRNDFVSIYAMGLKIWGPTQFVNFYFVPLDHRVMFLNLVSLVWNSYLAAAAGSKKTSSAEPVQITSK
jgi:protein Mpv17